MKNIVLGLIIAVIVAGAVFYIYRAKKRGQTCIGCPYAKECSKNCCCKSDK
jgi:hypothetical protein